MVEPEHYGKDQDAGKKGRLSGEKIQQIVLHGDNTHTASTVPANPPDANPSR